MNLSFETKAKIAKIKPTVRSGAPNYQIIPPTNESCEMHNQQASIMLQTTSGDGL